MTIARYGVVLTLLIVIGLPFLFRPTGAAAPADAERLIIVTPHREMIRLEFEWAFSDWHQRRYGRPVNIDWRVPGGTSEIRAQLMAQYAAAITAGRIDEHGNAEAGTMPYDLLFGGGSYEHEQMKRGVTVHLGPRGQEREVRVPLSAPGEFSRAQLDEWFGENRIGSELLYDPDLYWFGAALSSFGIVYNRDALAAMGATEPDSWDDLAHPRMAGWLGLADPRQSGSIATTYDSILNTQGWDRGWRMLRAMAANARYFSSSSAKIVIDVGSGEVAAALSIDFYGRYEAQAIARHTPGRSRLGYVDPPGAVYIDADPISIMRAGPNPVVARRFIEFVLSEEGQALWQFPVRSAAADEDELGPRRFELRRMPVRRVMYELHADRFVDELRPFEIAADVPPQGWRGMLGMMFGAFAIDIHHDMRRAWSVMNDLRDKPEHADLLREMESLFFAMPTHRTLDGRELEFNPDNFAEIRTEWRALDRAEELRIEYTLFFRDNYRKIVRLGREAGV